MPRQFSALLLLLVLSSGGCLTPREDASEQARGPDAEPGTAAVDCGPVEQPPQQSGSHLLGDEEPPVPYSSTPPTSGWHVSGAVAIGVHGPDEPLSEPRQVSVLESGGVVVTYNGLTDADRARLEEHVGDHYPGRVAVSPYEALEEGQVAFTGWGHLQRCTGLDVAALDAFVAEHADTAS